MAQKEDRIVKKAEEVFENWIDFQEVFEDVNFEQMGEELSEKNLSFFKSKYQDLLIHLNIWGCFFDVFSVSLLKKFKVLSDEELKKRFCRLYRLLENDMQGFIAYLKKSGFVQIFLDGKYDKATRNRLMSRYK